MLFSKLCWKTWIFKNALVSFYCIDFTRGKSPRINFSRLDISVYVENCCIFRESFTFLFSFLKIHFSLELMLSTYLRLEMRRQARAKAKNTNIYTTITVKRLTIFTASVPFRYKRGHSGLNSGKKYHLGQLHYIFASKAKTNVFERSGTRVAQK